MKSALNSISDVIRVSCEGASGPGLAWAIKVEMRPLRRGYSVWVYEDNVMTDFPKWQKVGESARLLTWRAAYRTIADNENFRVYGDFWRETEIAGMSRLEADIIRLAFVVDEDSPYDYQCLGSLLYGFSDEELRTCVPDAGLDPHEKPYSCDDEDEDPSDFQKLDALAKSVFTADLIGSSLAEIRSALGAGQEVVLYDLVTLLGETATDIRNAAREKARFGFRMNNRREN